MAENIETQLEERIRHLFHELEHIDPGSDEYKRLSDELQKLYEIRNDELKIHADEAKTHDTLMFESRKAEAEKSRFIKDKIIDVGKTLVTIGAYAILTGKILKFEETGVATSKTWMLSPKLNFLK